MVLSGVFYLLAVIIFFLWTGKTLEQNSAGKTTLLLLNDITEAAREGGISPDVFSERPGTAWGSTSHVP